MSLVINKLSYQYPDGKQALHGISFRVGAGETIGIVGANGAGKSTLLLHLVGILLATEGEVRLNDCMITKKNLREIRRQVGMVFQNPDDQLFMPTVAADVAFGPQNLGIAPAEVAEIVVTALKEVAAEHLAARPPYQLSGGEKRLVSIATVLALSPQILVFDEPSAALDPLARRRLIQLLAKLPQTKLIATHDLDLVLDLCQRTIILNEGRIIADGATLEIFNDSELMALGKLEKPLGMQGCPICSRKK